MATCAAGGGGGRPRLAGRAPAASGGGLGRRRRAKSPGKGALAAAGGRARRQLDVRGHVPIPTRLAVSLGPGVSAAWEVGVGNLVVQEVFVVCTDAGGRVLKASHFTEVWQFTPAGEGRLRGGKRPAGARFVGSDGRDYFAVGDGGPAGSRTTVWAWAWSLSRAGRTMTQLGLAVGGAGELAGSLPARLGALAAADRREPEVVRRFQFGGGAYSVDVYVRQGQVVGGGRAPAPPRPSRVPAVGERWERARAPPAAAAPTGVAAGGAWTASACKPSNAGLPSVRDRRRGLEGGIPYPLRMAARIRAEGAACAFSEHRRAAAREVSRRPSPGAAPWTPARPWRAADAAAGGAARGSAAGSRAPSLLDAAARSDTDSGSDGSVASGDYGREADFRSDDSGDDCRSASSGGDDGRRTPGGGDAGGALEATTPPAPRGGAARAGASACGPAAHAGGASHSTKPTGPRRRPSSTPALFGGVARVRPRPAGAAALRPGRRLRSDLLRMQQGGGAPAPSVRLATAPPARRHPARRGRGNAQAGDRRHGSLLRPCRGPAPTLVQVTDGAEEKIEKRKEK